MPLLSIITTAAMYVYNIEQPSIDSLMDHEFICIYISFISIERKRNILKVMHNKANTALPTHSQRSFFLL